MKKVLKKRTGFTLVELLIVIIIIGILAGAMLLVAGSGTDKAEATKIVSNLRSLKAAALMFYADKPNAVTADIELDSLKKYMDREITSPVAGATYVFNEGTVSGDVAWFVGLEGVNNYSSGVREKLEGVNSETGLVNTDKLAKFEPEADELFKTADEKVYMRAR